jgi:UDP-4-amino-4,6-dideoxy-N-acetyl-beta-L-altrosamine N-acetyltransferase
MTYNFNFVDILSVGDELKEKVRCWRNEERIRKSMLTQRVISKEEHFKWIESLRHKNDQKFWIVFANDVSIGSVYLKNIDQNKLRAEWGFYIGEVTHVGKGLGKHILYKLLKHFFEVMKFEVLFTKVFSDNTIALNIYRDFKFTEVSRLLSNNGREIITLSFSRADWEELNRNFDKCKYLK